MVIENSPRSESDTQIIEDPTKPPTDLIGVARIAAEQDQSVERPRDHLVVSLIGSALDLAGICRRLNRGLRR